MASLAIEILARRPRGSRTQCRTISSTDPGSAVYQEVAKSVGIPDPAVGINNRYAKPFILRSVTGKFNKGAVGFINRRGSLDKTTARIR